MGLYSVILIKFKTKLSDVSRIMKLEREKNASIFTALSKFCNLYQMLTQTAFAGLHLVRCFINIANGKTAVTTQCTEGNTFLAAGIQNLWTDMEHFYLHQLVYILTQNEPSCQAHKTRQNFYMISKYQDLCVCVSRHGTIKIFHPYSFNFFFSLPRCLLHSL